MGKKSDVLCLPRKAWAAFSSMFGGVKVQGTTLLNDGYFPIQHPSDLGFLFSSLAVDGCFLSRQMVDKEDEGLKVVQLIPYIVLAIKKKDSRKVFDLVFLYTRRGTEDRLADFKSIGVGGHIEAGDFPDDPDAFDYREGYCRAVLRELDEEISIKSESPITGFDNLFSSFGTYTGKQGVSVPIGILQSSVDDVSRRHVGLVHMLIIDENKVPMIVAPASSETVRGQFHDRQKIIDAYNKDPQSFESWSRLTIKQIIPH